MSRVIEIPGGSATIRDPDEVRQRARRRLELASIDASPIYRRINDERKRMSKELGREATPDEVNLMEVGLSREDFDVMYEVQTATILAYLADWSLERELPKTAEDLDELPAGLYDAIRLATARDGADAVAPPNFEVSPDPDSPTVPSGESDRFSKDGQESMDGDRSTRSRRGTGGNSPTAVSSEE